MMVQGSPEWWAARLGKLTGSKAACIMGDLKTAGLASYVMDVAWERVHGERDEGYRNAAMERGKELEPEAREWLAFDRGLHVTPVGFLQHPELDFVGASPDSLVDEDAILEIKCPLHKAWMEVKRTRRVPSEYRWQVRWEMWCAGRSRAHFLCYHPIGGGIVVPFGLDDGEAAAMRERAIIVDGMVREWVAILESEGC